MARPAASSTALLMRLPVESRSNDVSRALLLFNIACCAVIEAMFVLIESGIAYSFIKLTSYRSWVLAAE
jgi:hypothetical protein